jgi:ribonucleoside-diphosphate reductase alpha chain
MAKEGSTLGGMMDAFATAISLCLQYGVPIETLVKKFSHQRFEPSGMTRNRDIPFAKSIVDYIFRWLGLAFMEDYRKANLPNRPELPVTRSTSTTAPEAVRDDSTSEPARAERVFGREVSQPVGALFEGRYESTWPKADDGNGDSAKAAVRSPAGADRPATVKAQIERIDQHFSHFQEDAPPCPVCGAITVRNGNCYKCFNCAESLGCS